MRRLLLVAALVLIDIVVGASSAAHWPSQQSTVRTEALQYSPQAVPAVIVTTTSTTTMVAPTTTSPPVHKVIRAPRAEPTSATTSAPTSGDVFDRLAQCESGMHNDTAGPFYGYFQFLPGTWHSMGESGMPYDHDYATQKAAAQRLVARSGWSQFPACGRRLGMR